MDGRKSNGVFGMISRVSSAVTNDQNTAQVAEVVDKIIPIAVDTEAAKGTVDVAGDSRSDSESDSNIVIDPKAERKLVRKLDLCLLPICWLLTMINFLDKVNIGNARIQGLEKELGMDPKSNQFNFLLSIFWVTYILSEVPSNIILKNVAPSTYLSIVTICYGS